MTLQQMLELIQQSAPKLGATQLTLELNAIQRSFCADTRVLVKKLDLLACSALAIVERQWYEFPENCKAVMDVKYADSTAKEPKHLYRSHRVLVENEVIKFVDTHGNLNTLPDVVQQILLTYRAYPAKLANKTDVPEIPEQFHMALVVKRLEPIAMSLGDSKLAMYYASEYKKHELAAKRLANQRGTDCNYSIDTEA